MHAVLSSIGQTLSSLGSVSALQLRLFICRFTEFVSIPLAVYVIHHHMAELTSFCLVIPFPHQGLCIIPQCLAHLTSLSPRYAALITLQPPHSTRLSVVSSIYSLVLVLIQTDHGQDHEHQIVLSQAALPTSSQLSNIRTINLNTNPDIHNLDISKHKHGNEETHQTNQHIKTISTPVHKHGFDIQADRNHSSTWQRW